MAIAESVYLSGTRRWGFVVVRFLGGLSAGSGCNGHDFSVIPLGMAHRVGPKGQVVIPKAMRDRLGIIPGDQVDFALEDDAVRVEPVRARSSLRGTLSGIGLTAVLEADHRREQDG
jgi:AbrB family looped-hinge helix DNA binding protein